MPRFHSSRFFIFCLTVVGGTNMLPVYGQIPESSGSPVVVTLEGTLRRAFERDPRILEYRFTRMAHDARVEEIRSRGGWTFEITGRSEDSSGDRREFRNTTRGRSERDIRGHLDEDENFLRIGFTKEFLDENRKRKLDITEERLNQLGESVVFFSVVNNVARTTVDAYLDVYYVRSRKQLLQEQLLHQEEALQALKSRVEQSEALETEISDLEADLIQTRKELLEVQFTHRRRLGKLRELWEIPNLREEDLAAPPLAATDECEKMDLESLINVAQTQRPDLLIAEQAISVQSQAGRFTKVLPEVELELSGQVKDFDRDFADEGRDDSTVDMRVELGISVPIKLAKRNAARMKQQAHLLKARQFGLEGLRRKIREEVEETYQRYVLACEELRLRKKRLDHAEKMYHVTELTAHTLPESLGQHPSEAVRESRLQVILAKMKLLDAEYELVRNRIDLQAATGDLTRGLFSTFEGGKIGAP